MAQVKFLKIANNLPTEHDGTADDLTLLSVSTDTINERTGAAGVTIDSVVLKDGGVNLAASSNYQINGVDIIADSAGTATLSNIDALDATTEATIEAAIDTLSNLTTVGALDSGSITANFGNIDNGTSNITTGGILKLDVDGTGINAAGSLTYGAGDDAAIYWDGDENYLHQTTALTNAITYNTLLHETSGTPANGIGVGLQFEQETTAGNNEKVAALVARVTDVTATSEDAALDVRLMIAGAAHATTATFDLDGLNLASGDDYSINGTSVLSATTLGSGVTASSLTSVGTLATGTWQADTIGVQYGGTGATTLGDGFVLLGSGTGAITALDVTAKGSLMVGDGTTDPIALAVGTNDQVLTADSAQSGGVKWADAAGGDTEAYTNGEAGSIALGDVVYMSTTNNEVLLADADTIAQGDVIVGLAAATITTSSSGNIHVTRGKVLAGAISAATAGDVYYLSATGTTGNTLTTTAPSGGPALVKIGFAKNATDLVFDPEFIADTTS